MSDHRRGSITPGRPRFRTTVPTPLLGRELGAEPLGGARAAEEPARRDWTHVWFSIAESDRRPDTTDEHRMTDLPLSQDAATVVGLAGTALAFAQSTDEEVERWLRPLRLYGEAGIVLQELAVGEAPLTARTEDPQPSSAAPPNETMSSIVSAASELAAQRGMSRVGTTDVLVAVMDHYSDAFARALKNHGTDPAELIEYLALHAPVGSFAATVQRRQVPRSPLRRGWTCERCGLDVERSSEAAPPTGRSGRRRSTTEANCYSA